MYVSCMLPVSFVLLVVAFVCFASASPENSEIFNITWHKIEKALPSSAHVDEVRASIRHDNLMLAAGCLSVSSCNFVPCLLGILLSIKLKHRPHTSQADESHLRVVLRVSNYVILAFGFVCFIYGAYATHYTMSLDLVTNVFTPFLLMQVGIVLSLLSLLGFWVSTCESPVIMAGYAALLIPAFAVLVGLGSNSFASLKGVNDMVQDHAQDGKIPQGSTPGEVGGFWH
jgi:hypothetical protein